MFDFIKLFQTFGEKQADGDGDNDLGEVASELMDAASDIVSFLHSGRAARDYSETFRIFKAALTEVAESMKRNFGHIEFAKFKPHTIIYFLEYMESLRTPSWKRRMHGFSTGVSIQEAKELHRDLYLANLAYANTADDIKKSLVDVNYELVYAQLTNAPNEPAHYVALPKNKKEPTAPLMTWVFDNSDDVLEVTIAVRGTKDLADILSDGLLDAVDFRGGKAHAGMVLSGQFIVDRHVDFLRQLLEMSKKKRIDLTLVGHSLGGGAAAIAGMIIDRDYPDIDVQVVGFGTPALVSEELSDTMKGYVTTVVSDSDMIPRLSGATLENAIYDIMGYDWIEQGLKDLKSAFEAAQAILPFLPNEKFDAVYDSIEKFLDEQIKPEMEELGSMKRADVALIPPGSCIHFYRDGNAVSGQKINCDFFDSLEVSRTMIDDHMVGIGYNRNLLDFVRAKQADYEFVFDEHIYDF